MLEVEGIDVAYGDLPALRNLTLRVEQGEIVALVGSNGAGKTQWTFTLAAGCALLAFFVRLRRFPTAAG